MKAFILIGAAVLLVVVGIILRAGATEWAMVPVRGVSNQLTLDSEKESMIRDTGNAFALFGVICFTAGVYGWMSYRVQTSLTKCQADDRPNGVPSARSALT